MAKLIYEDDQGQQTVFEITQETVDDLQSFYSIDAWDEAFNSFKTFINKQQSAETA